MRGHMSNDTKKLSERIESVLTSFPTNQQEHDMLIAACSEVRALETALAAAEAEASRCTKRRHAHGSSVTLPSRARRNCAPSSPRPRRSVTGWLRCSSQGRTNSNRLGQC